MKQTLSTNEVTHALLQDDNAAWSYDGAKALSEYLDDMEVEMETEMELDVVALRCDFSEYESLVAWADDYGADMGDAPEDEDERDEEIRSYIQDRGQLIEFEGGIISSSF